MFVIEVFFGLGSANNPEKLYQLKDEFFGRLPASNAAEIPAQTK